MSQSIQPNDPTYVLFKRYDDLMRGVHNGRTLLDEFAMATLLGGLANPILWPQKSPNQIAGYVYDLATAMQAESLRRHAAIIEECNAETPDGPS